MLWKKGICSCLVLFGFFRWTFFQQSPTYNHVYHTRGEVGLCKSSAYKSMDHMCLWRIRWHFELWDLWFTRFVYFRCWSVWMDENIFQILISFLQLDHQFLTHFFCFFFLFFLFLMWTDDWWTRVQWIGKTTNFGNCCYKNQLSRWDHVNVYFEYYCIKNNRIGQRTVFHLYYLMKQTATFMT